LNAPLPFIIFIKCREEKRVKSINPSAEKLKILEQYSVERFFVCHSACTTPPIHSWDGETREKSGSTANQLSPEVNQDNGFNKQAQSMKKIQHSKGPTCA
jgi:hypothetical protein